MSALILVTIAAGLVASISCFKAVYDSGVVKRREENPKHAVQFYWGVIGAYMVFFTLLRIFHFAGIGLEREIFYAQTIAGACTIVALSYIFFSVWKGPDFGRWAAEVALMSAFVTVFLIFAYGIEGPIVDDWGVELIPNLMVARIIITVLYVAMPMAMGALIVVASQHETAEFRRRKMLFGVGMFLIYAPNAIRYVTITQELLGAVLAIIMALGCLIGLHAHRNPVGNA